jgi:hypothetical protein
MTDVVITPQRQETQIENIAGKVVNGIQLTALVVVGIPALVLILLILH